MKLTTLLTTLCALSAAAAAQTASASHIGFGLGNGGATLFQFAFSDPGTIVDSVPLTNNVDALDFRPATNELYAYDDDLDQYFVVNPFTGELTLASTTVTPTTSLNLDIDWNPTIDRMRTVTESDQNIVFNPDTGAASDAATTALFYALGDANAGADPAVTGNAYSNSFAGATTTQQFVLDHQLNTLATLANNAGTLTTIAPLTVGGGALDFSADIGFDIFFNGVDNVAYALLTAAGSTGLYDIDLSTGSATLLTSYDANAVGTVVSLAVIDGPDLPTPVAAPSALALFAFGALLLGVRRPR